MNKTHLWLYIFLGFIIILLIYFGGQTLILRERVDVYKETQQTQLQAEIVMSQNIENLVRMNQELTRRIEWLESQFVPLSPTPTLVPPPPGIQASH